MVVTRASEQVDGLAGLLVEAGAVPVVVPLIEIVDVTGTHQPTPLRSSSPANSLAA